MDASMKLIDHSTAAAVAGTVRLSLRRIGAVSTRPATSAASGGAMAIHQMGSRSSGVGPRRQRAARKTAEHDERGQTGGRLRGVPRQARRSHVDADERRESVPGRKDAPGRRDDFGPRRETQHEREHRRSDTARCPSSSRPRRDDRKKGKTRGRIRPLTTNRDDAEDGRLPPRQPSQQQREGAGADVRDLSADFREAPRRQRPARVSVRHHSSVSDSVCSTGIRGTHPSSARMRLASP